MCHHTLQLTKSSAQITNFMNTITSHTSYTSHTNHAIASHTSHTGVTVTFMTAPAINCIAVGRERIICSAHAQKRDIDVTDENAYYWGLHHLCMDKSEASHACMLIYLSNAV